MSEGRSVHRRPIDTQRALQVLVVYSTLPAATHLEAGMHPAIMHLSTLPSPLLDTDKYIVFFVQFQPVTRFQARHAHHDRGLSLPQVRYLQLCSLQWRSDYFRYDAPPLSRMLI